MEHIAPGNKYLSTREPNNVIGIRTHYDVTVLHVSHGNSLQEIEKFGLILWHINHCRLFNAKSSLYIYIKYIWFSLVGFNGTSTIVGYLMPNPIDRNISGVTTPGQSWPRSDGNKGVLCIPQSSSVTGVLPSDFLCHILDIHWTSLTPQQRYSKCILQAKPTVLPRDWGISFKREVLQRRPLRVQAWVVSPSGSLGTENLTVYRLLHWVG